MDIPSTLFGKSIIVRAGVRQFIKFGIVGVINTAVDYGTFTILVYAVHLNYLIANIISFGVAVTNSYYLNRRWTFRTGGQSSRGEVIKFFVVNIIGLGINEAILFGLVDALHLSKLVAKGLGIVVALFWNFLGTKFWAFRVKG